MDSSLSSACLLVATVLMLSAIVATQHTLKACPILL